MSNDTRPEIRFPGFTEDWEERKLGELTESFDGKRVPIDSDLRISGKYPYYGATGIIDYVDDYIFNGEYVLLAEDGANIIMRNYPVAYLTQGKFWLNNHAHIMRMRNGSNYFLVQVLEKIDYKKYNTGTAQPKLNSKIVKNIELKIPHIEEQQQIGNFFKQLDDIIALHQRKLDLLKETKKGFLQKMFPKNGAKVPEIRFPGFTGDWEQRKLGEYLVPYNEVTTENNQYPVLTSSRKGLFFQKDYYDGNQIASEDNTGYNIVPRGYFTYRHMSDDLIFKFNINDIADKGIVSTLYPVFTTTSDLDSKYLQYQLNGGQEFKRFAILQKQGGSRTYMYLSKLKNMFISIPKYNEQIKISTFFKQLDDTIALHQRKLDLLKETKKGFLQMMFV
ncbi:restriction endonuclease subunit S [Enterococcus faecium]|uniref:restriction endonuclease subunit S n=3 Tax=Enterococcus TaxID=1350 RepID=UPI00032F0A47|nr:restriction endonuclease subunit S [Enterococcus faecium]EOM66102.1 hypothetical protein SKC_01828 [Enterococcus faecium EnGen0164]MCD4990095.1 restriction endonuclease subunit S [Enterococcus faecium]HAZ0988698.1 restriction endonuclease subunit S [Enterococcus faecium]